MKITYRIPQKEQYSYIEVEVEVEGQNLEEKPDSYETIKKLFEDDREGV